MLRSANRRNRFVSFVLLAGVNIVAAPAVMAQAPSEAPQGAAANNDVGEIIVTAQRRSERAQNVPIAINAYSSEALASVGIADSQNLNGLVPGFSFTKSSGSQYYLRGVGTSSVSVNSEQSVASYVDGVYVFSTYGSMPLGNVERVEVLKGPQGTLFGRNTTGGVIQAVTRDPLAPESFRASIGYGNYNTFDALAYGNTHISDNFGLSIALEDHYQGDGFGRNTTRGEDTFFRRDWSVQLKGALKLGADTTITAFMQYRRNVDSGPAYHPIPGTRDVLGADGSSYGRFEIRGAAPDALTVDDWLGYLRVEHQFGDFATLTSITSYHKITPVYLLDQDGTPVNLVTAEADQTFRNWSQEIQLASAGHGPLTWTTGLYYYTAKAGYEPISLSGAAAAAAGGLIREYHSQDTNSIAGYGQATYAITSTTNFTAGARYTHETQKLPSSNYTLLGPDPNPVRIPFPTNRVDSSGWTWRLALDQHFTNDIMGYVSYNRGLKGGTFALVTTGFSPAVNPEKLDAYEAGFKMEFLNHRLRFNPSVFLYKFKNIQVSIVSSGVAALQNAASATIKGVDLDSSFDVTRQLRLWATFEYLESRFDRFTNAQVYIASSSGGATSNIIDASGNDLPYAPKYSGATGFDFHQPLASGELRLDGSVRYLAKQHTNASNLYVIPSYTLLNAGIGWSTEDEKFGIRIWGSNLLDKSYIRNVVGASVGIMGFPGDPRTYGVTLKTKF